MHADSPIPSTVLFVVGNVGNAIVILYSCILDNNVLPSCIKRECRPLPYSNLAHKEMFSCVEKHVLTVTHGLSVHVSM